MATSRSEKRGSFNFISAATDAQRFLPNLTTLSGGMDDLIERRRLIRDEVTGVIGEVELHLSSQAATRGKLSYYY